MELEFVSLHLCLNSVLKKGVLESSTLCVPISLFSGVEEKIVC